MAASYTINVGLTKPGTNDRGWGDTVNADLDVLDGLAAVGSLAVATFEAPSASLVVRVAAGSYRNAAGAVVAYAGASSVTLGASVTSYLYLTDAGVLTVNTTGFPAGANVVPLATVVTGTSTVTSIADSRRPWTSCGGTPPAFVASGTNHAAGIVPDPGATPGTTKYLREDATWVAPPGSSTFVASGGSHAGGLVPDPGSSAGTTKYLREDATWVVPTSAAVFVASGGSHAQGLVPDPGSSAGTTHFLREDATWATIPVMVASGASHAAGLVPDPGVTAGTSKYLREDGAWVTPAGAGTVTSVALAMPAAFTASGSPVTGSGTLTASWATQSANQVLAGPGSGSPSTPTFRSLLFSDLPVVAPYTTADGTTVTFDLANGPNQSVTLGGNRTLAIANDVNGSKLELTLKQDGTGSRTVTWFAGIRWAAGTAPTLTTAAGKEDVFLIERRASGDYRGYVLGQNY